MSNKWRQADEADWNRAAFAIDPHRGNVTSSQVRAWLAAEVADALAPLDEHEQVGRVFDRAGARIYRRVRASRTGERFRVRGWDGGFAVRVVGWLLDLDDLDEYADAPATEWVGVVMVGDDTVHLVEAHDLARLDLDRDDDDDDEVRS